MFRLLPLLALALGAPATHAAPAIAPVDAPIDILETGVPVIVQMAGRFAWLDDDTLAITTFAAGVSLASAQTTPRVTTIASPIAVPTPIGTSTNAVATSPTTIAAVTTAITIAPT